ncbi:MAG: NlpC/P60 family protein [Erysipelotrichales bacterium]
MIKKYLLVFSVLMMFVVCTLGSTNSIKATKLRSTTSSYYSNKKIKSKTITEYDSKTKRKYLITRYDYNNKGTNTSKNVTTFDAKSKRLTLTKYSKVKSKFKMKAKYFYYNTHSKAKTKKVTTKAYRADYYNSKGKYVKSKYSTKDGQRNAVVALAKSQNGRRYRAGGKSPSGFDCSGLTSYVYGKSVSKNIGRTSYSQNKKGKTVKVSTKSLKPGDVLFWGSKKSPYHVGIYLGSGKYIHASTPRSGVQIKKLNSFKPSYAKRMI